MIFMRVIPISMFLVNNHNEFKGLYVQGFIYYLYTCSSTDYYIRSWRNMKFSVCFNWSMMFVCAEDKMRWSSTWGQKVQVLGQEDPLALHHLFIQGCMLWVLTHLRESKMMERVNVIHCLFHQALLLVLLLLLSPTHGQMDHLKTL